MKQLTTRETLAVTAALDWMIECIKSGDNHNMSHLKFGDDPLSDDELSALRQSLGDDRRLELEVALEAVKIHQTDLWEALGDLENLLDGKVELDANTDYEGYDVDMLLSMAEGTEFEKAER